MEDIRDLTSDIIVHDGIYERGFMGINKNISMDFPMPAELRRYIDGMDKAFDENDTDSWDFYHEAIGYFAKIVTAVGR